MDCVRYLGNVININWVTEEDIVMRIGKTRTAFNVLKNMWKSKLQKKIKISNSNMGKHIDVWISDLEGNTLQLK